MFRAYWVKVGLTSEDGEFFPTRKSRKNPALCYRHKGVSAS
jgi:hypothetical protein